MRVDVYPRDKKIFHCIYMIFINKYLNTDKIII